MSPAQLGIWYAQHVDPQVPVNIAQYVDLRGDLDVAALERASADAALEMGSGFLRIIERDGEPLQTVDPSLDATLEYVDLRDAEDPEAAAQEWMRAEYSQPLDIVKDRLIRAAALRIEDHRWFWYSRAHHIALDGFGAMTFMTRIAELYTAYVTGAEPAPSKAADLRTLYESEIAYRDSTRFQSDKEHWAQRVAGLEEGSSLAGRSAPPSPVNGIVSAALSEEQDSLLTEAVARHDSSPAAMLIAGFAAYLAQLTGNEEVILSLPVTARTTAAMRRSGGVASNIVPLRLHVGYDTSVTELLRQVQVEVSGALRHQRYRHEDIRRDSAGDGVVTTEFFGPWVNIMLFHDELVLGPMVGQLSVLSTGSIEDLGVNFYQSVAGTRSHIDFETNPNLYTEDEARRHHGRFLEFFDRFLAADAETAVWQLDVTTAAERTESLVEWNDSAHEVPTTTLPALLDAQIPRTPDNIALDFEGATLTYAEFDERVNRLGRFLIADGVGPESLVALGMRRSLELVIGMHAVLKAGGAYVPIDPDHPADRTAYILDSAAPVCVLTISGDELELPESVQRVEIDTLDVSGYSAEPITDADRRAPLRPDNTAYVIYTSGSTGRPKGVAVTHHAIVNQQLWMLDEYQLTADDVYLQKTATTFDVSLWGYFLPLMVGAKLVIAASDGHRDPLYVAQMIAEHRVTITDFVPSMLTVFVSHATPAQVESLRAVFVIGEALPPETAAAFRAITSAGLHNLYGPTEAAVSVTYWEATAADTVTVPIGIPEWNVEVYVLDSRLRPAPIGAPGELYLGGRQLARGYRGRPDLTSDRFVANPLSPNGERMYRTGDLVRWNAAGVLEYIGRTDFQVKFRGQRIELGEIETDLLAHSAVSQAVVLVVDTATGQQLVAYVVPAPGQTVESAELTRFVAEKLPSYMVPASIMVLDAFPLNTSGKLDRKALPEPVFAADASGFRAPRTQAEQVVAGIFADVLSQDRIGIDDNFFDLGGNSLVATQVVSRISAAFDTQLGVRALFETPTVAGIAARAEHSASTAGARPPLVAQRLPERVPLSLAQQRMWFINQFDPTVPTYNLPFVVRLRGRVDVEALQTALDDVVARQESLRTIFPESGDGGYQFVIPVEQVDLGITVEPIDEAELPGVLAGFASTGFDVSRELPIRVRIYEVTGGRGNGTPEYAVAFVVHHIAADGFSFGPLARDVAAAYLARAEGEEPSWTPLPVQYQDYSIWQRELLGSESDPESMAAREIAYWQRALAGLPDQLDLPTDRPRPAVQSFQGGRVGFTIDAELHQRLSALARAQGVSLFMVMHASLAVLLARLSGTTDIAIGTPVAGRGEQALDDLIGMFVNTLVLRSEVDGSEQFTEFLTRTRETDLAAFANTDVPFERLVEVLNPTRSQARHPLFQVMLSFQEMSHATLELPGLSVTADELEVDIAKFDLQWTVTEERAGDGAPAGMSAVVSYATDLFDESTVDEFTRRYLRVLETVVAEPATAVRDIEILDDAERATVLSGWNDTTHEVPAATVLELFAEQVRQRPDELAVVFDAAGRIDGLDEELTYAEFAARVNRLARKLIDAGVGPESLVAVGIRRSVDMLVALYATMTAGGGYVPIDPDHPAERTEYVLESSAPVCVLTTIADNISAGEVPVIFLDTEDLSGYSDAPVTDADRRAPLRPSNTAYVLYTSGSTGRPKGVAVSHASVVNQIAWITAEYRMSPADVVLQKTPVTFDVSVWELFGTLAVGARMLIAAPDGHRDPLYLSEIIGRHKVTMTSFVPSMLSVFAGAANSAECASLRAVLVAGEALPPATVTAFRQFSTAAMHNLYGPTEFTVHATAWHLNEVAPASVPIGRPVWNARAYVLDEGLSPVPVGVPGELYLGGVQTARGYHGRPDLTAERFVADPFGPPGSRLYRTGDLVRWTEPHDPEVGTAGVLEYIGRTDFQVKFRGQRIELGEIETALLEHPAVNQAVVLVLDTVAGDQLVGYVVTDAGPVDIDSIKGALHRTLPSYMVPSAIVVLEALPLNPSGKLDRRALPAPVFEVREFRAPTTPIEEIVAQIFGEVLGITRVGVDDDFFELGGNSLIATQVASRLGIALDTRVPVRMLFEASTVAALAARVESHAGDGARKALVARDRPEEVPLSLAQQRMWFLNRFDTESAVNNIPVAIRLSGDLDVAALQVAVIDVIDRHESLRTVFPETSAGPVQVVLDAAQIVPDLTPIPVTEHNLIDHLVELASMAFDVTSEVPLHARLFEINETEYVLGMVVHHISADGWSMGPLARDVMVAYAARTSWEAPAWSALPVQYADYALWQREVLGEETDPDSVAGAQLDYWTKELADLPDELNLPSDRPRPPAQSFAGGKTEFVIDAGVHAALTDLARTHNATLFMVVHTALTVFLSRMSGTDDIAVGTPIAGRGEAELDDLIGMFVNTLVLRTRVAPELSFDQLLAANRDTDLRAFANADIPFERLVEALDPERSAGRHPLFQVALSFENLAATGFELPGLSFAALDPAADAAKFDLLLTVREQRDEHGAEAGIAAEFTYARDLFDESTVVDFGRRFRRILAAVARDSSRAVGDLDILDDSERLDLISRTGAPAEPVRTLPELMADAVAANPTGVAVVVGERSFRYAELDAASAQLARALIERGAGPDVLVAVALRRSVESVLALWAVAKTGAALVPIDPTYPADRIAHMVRDSGASLGITMNAELDDLPPMTGGGWIRMDDRGFTMDVAARSDRPITAADLRGPIRAGNAAYVIYTSGSTGLPKGVVVTHAGLANFSAEQVQRYHLDTSTRALAFASPSFDASMLELLLALGSAGTLVVAPPLMFGGDELAELIRTEGVTHAFITPSVLASLDSSALSGMRAIVAGGEAVPAELVAKWGGMNGRAFHNGYGPTETTIMTNISDPLRPGDPVTIGAPIRGMRALVLDTRLRPVPEGVAGELYLGGIQLARGYHARAGLTAARFVADPYGAPGERLYRTGDVVRWRGREVEYMGRNDFQVKVRGFRIELGEIDSALAAQPGIDFAVTIGRETAAGATILVSYVLPERGVTPDVGELTAQLGRVLPDYMVPTAIVVLDEIPLTPVGKLDRRALPEPVLETRAYRAPRSTAEQVIAEVIGEVLGVDQVGLDDDFFALGGDSIVSIQVVSRARAKGVDFTPREVFQARTVEALAAAATVGGAPGDEAGELPATPTAMRLLEHGGSGVEPRAIVLEVPASCPAEAVETAVGAVLDQHPMLWARLDTRGAVPVLRIPVAADRGERQFSWLDPELGETTLPIDDVVGAAVDALDPEQGRNIHFVATGTPEAFRLVVVANAMVVDDVSWRTIIDQLTTAWNRGRHAAPAAPESGLGALIRSLAERAHSPAIAAEAQWWQQTLAAATRDDLPTGAADLRSRRRVSLTITAEGTEAVAAVAEAYHASVDEVLLTAVALALHTAQRESVTRAVGSVIRLDADGRAVAEIDASNIVGGFRTAYPLPLRLDGIDVPDALVGGRAAGAALTQIKELHRAVPGRGVGYGLLCYLNPEAAAGLRDFGRGRFALRYRDLRPARVHTDAPADDLLLALTVDATDDGLLARFDYAAAVFAADEVKTFAEHWIRALGGLAEHGLRPDAGGFSPSDFPLISLRQDDIDRFARDYPQLTDAWPVTPLQSGMLFHALLADTSVDVYTTQFVLELGGTVDPARMQAAAQAVLDRHANLRVAFADDAEGAPVQIVQDGIEVPWRMIDLSHLDPAAAAAEAERIKSADLADHFDMRTAPLLRFTLIRTSAAGIGAESAYQLLVTSHHILIDGWSMPLLMKDLLTLYALGGNSRHLPQVPPYRDYLAWLIAQDPEAARQAWRTALAGITEPTPLAPVDPGREISAGVGEVGFELSQADTTALTRLAAHLGVTVNTVVQAAWGLLIGRSVDRDDVVFGATVSGRPPQLDGVEAMVGLFLNAIPVRVRLGATDTLGGLLRQLQAEQADLLGYHYLGLSDIQDAVGVEGLFDSLVVFESFPVDREGLAEASAIDGMNITGVGAVNGTHYPVTVMVVLDHQLRVSVKYLRDLFDTAAADALARRLEAAIGRFVTEPQAKVADIDVLLPAEAAELAARNATAVPELLDDATLLTLFDAQVARTPDAPAVRYRDAVLSYRELDARSRALAAELNTFGVGPGTLVGVAMRRGLDLVVSIYAVLRAGAGYVPIDPDHPAERSEYVLSGAAPICVLTTSADGFGTGTGVPVVAVDTLYLAPADGFAGPRVHPDDIAYVIYTSGSTGRPKGVMITHRQMANQFRWAQRTYPHDTSDVVLHKTPITFDISTWELFWPLHTGASIVIAEPDGHRDPAYLARTIADNAVTTVHFVPSMLDAFLDPVASGAAVAEYPSLRRVFAAGEALSGETAATFTAALPGTALINWYGPAEATVVTAHPVTDTGVTAIPIGTPVANTEVLVLDRQLRPVPPGAAGELYVAGVQLARGYHDRPALTAERFVAGAGGTRLYRTGDVVRWTGTGADAALEYLGRSDFQVKLRGQRVELGEIETILLGHETVRHAAVSLVRAATGDRLVAYVVAAPGHTIDDRELLAHARAALPSYMVPSAVVVLEQMPLNASGKLDRMALPVPQLSGRPFRAPTTPLERTITEVFAEVLGVERVGMDDDFFDLGGNSLIATRAVSRLRTRTGAEIRVQWFFTDSTPADLATRILAVLSGEHDYDLDSNAALGVVLPIRTRVPHDTAPDDPVFCIHPMYGLSWCYAGFARYLPARYPIYGLQSPALSEDGYLPRSLTEMARRYAAEIRAVQPQGPYRLLGWSLGGVIAHAIATELQAAGHEVTLLAMLDSHPAIDVTDFRAAIRDALAELGIGDAQLPDGDIHDLTDEALAALHATIPPDMAVLTPERVRRIYRSAVRSAELIAEHRPGVFRGRLDYFSAAGHDTAAGNWDAYVDGTVADHPVAADHDQMTSPEALAEIGPLLADRLDPARTAGRT
ncbi:amino acid adenylation domain-containing protein [Nocardia cyriacigeorgica]|uniref:amino acid adenylation domain-containing protein n=1 Tax=Nocardia cyriacigeorgica TaxID=135487 RepID=UPI003CC7F854